MPRKALALLPSLLLAPLTVPLGCGTGPEPVRASVIANLTLPRGVLAKATHLELRVLEGPVTCDAANGTTTGEGAKEIAKKDLTSENCPANVRFCGDVSIAKSSAARVFTARATDGSEGVLAIGCASATIESDTAAVAIKMRRFLAPPVCGDRTIQPTEQCEPGGTALCDDKCSSVEILLSAGASGNATSTGKAGDKTDPDFLWPQGAGDDGRFFAFYTDRAVAGGDVEIGLRVMSPDLAPATTPPELAEGSLFLPNGGSFPPPPTPGSQSNPQTALLGGKYYVVFQDDNTPASSDLDIHLRTITSALQSEQAAGTPLFVNGGGSGEPGVQSAPSIAASADRLFVAWEDQAEGKIVGRTLTPPSSFGNQNVLSSGNGNARPEVASTGNGWVTVWTSGTGIKLRTVNADGTPSGREQTVNASGAGAAGGRVASLPDGRFAVVWSNGGDIFIQRFDAKGLPIADDQTEPLNDVVTNGDQTQPAIAALPAAGGSYVVAWHDASTNHIRARFASGTTGFLFNNVNGQSTEFQASRLEGRSRTYPVVAVGGNVSGAPAVAIGWEDKSASSAGIMVRRFPLPSD